MTITKIEKYNSQENITLDMKDDYIFDHTFIEITNKDTNPEDILNLLYRMLWENIYIKNSINSRYNTSECVIVISLSEAIDFLRLAVPPILLKNKSFEEAVENIDDVVELLKNVLIDGGKEQSHYNAIFCDKMRYKPFQTNWNDDNSITKLNIIKDKENNTKYCVSGTSNDLTFDDFINKSTNTGSYTITVGIYNPSKCKDILAIVHAAGMRVSNITIRDRIVYARLSAYNMEIDSLLISEIRKSYKNYI